MRLLADGVELYSQRPCTVRPLANQYFNLPQNACLGFSFTVPEQLILKSVVLTLLCTASNGGELLMWEVRIFNSASRPPFTSSPLFLMHIPKTAGSSLNAFCASHYPCGWSATHLESLQNYQNFTSTMLRSMGFLSGHLTLQAVRSKDYIDDRFVTLTVLREPWSQLRSHLSWVRRLALPEHKVAFEQHAPMVQKAALRLHEQGPKRFLQSMDANEKKLFHNVQSRYLLNLFQSDPQESDLELAFRNLRAFDIVGITERMRDSLKLLCTRMAWKKTRRLKRENVSSYRMPAEDFIGADNPTLDEALWLDREVYKLGLELLNERLKSRAPRAILP